MARHLTPLATSVTQARRTLSQHLLRFWCVRQRKIGHWYGRNHRLASVRMQKGPCRQRPHGRVWGGQGGVQRGRWVIGAVVELRGLLPGAVGCRPGAWERARLDTELGHPPHVVSVPSACFAVVAGVEVDLHQLEVSLFVVAVLLQQSQ